MEIAPGIHRLGSRMVNWFMIEEGGRLTVIDAGLPKQWDQLVSQVSALGMSLNDIEAVLLTHAHPDHVGFAERTRQEAGATVHVHGLDAKAATGEEEGPRANPLKLPLWKLHTMKFLASMIRGGVFNVPEIREVSEMRDGETLDLPGKPVVMHTPGHTPGSSCLFLEQSKVLFSGDALVTLNVLTGDTTPGLLPHHFNWDQQQAQASMTALRTVDADLVLPGHGEPWTSGVAEAVQAAQRP